MKIKWTYQDVPLLGIIGICCLVLGIFLGSEIAIGFAEVFPRFKQVTVDITAYSPTEEQTDDRPRETASGKVVTDWELREQRFVAVSQDLIKKFNIKWGDTVWLPYIVEDTMHRDIKLGVDRFVLTEELANDIGRKTGIVLFQISKEE